MVLWINVLNCFVYMIINTWFYIVFGYAHCKKYGNFTWFPVVEPVPFCIISTPGNQMKLQYFSQRRERYFCIILANLIYFCSHFSSMQACRHIASIKTKQREVSFLFPLFTIQTIHLASSGKSKRWLLDDSHWWMSMIKTDFMIAISSS